MIEKICLSGKDIWITVDPHTVRGDNKPSEYFTASYHLMDPATAPGAILFVEEDQSPKQFLSPVEAVEYANEKLLGLV